MEFNVGRVWTVVLRYFYGNRKTMSSYFDFFYWPLMDILLFGYIGTWFANQQNPYALLTLVLGLVLWQIAYRINLDIAKNLVQELWDENLINLFTTPLTLPEWIAGLITLGCINIVFTLAYSAIMVYLFFGQNIFILGPALFIFIGLLIMSGWILGFIASGFLIYWGQKIDTVIWAIGWLPVPFCSVYYPMNILPAWMQTVGKFLPMSYAFEGMRAMVQTHQIPYWHIGVSFALNIIYLICALSFFLFMFKKSKNNGLRTN